MKRKERERTSDMGEYDETNELVEAALLHINDYTSLCGKGELSYRRGNGTTWNDEKETLTHPRLSFRYILEYR